MRTPIQALDDLTIGRIAAGEVIERPSSVVKELVENSLDAGATDIRVEIQLGGRRLVRIQDNGSGIPSGEVLLAFQRHATSKLRSAAELETIATLGFRGEALASIASVSHVTLSTRTADEREGTLIRIDNGEVLLQQSTGSPTGTSFTVENLFSAVPARLKFLKTDATEGSRIVELVGQYALAHPEKRFTLVRDGRTVLRSPGTGDVRVALEAVYGADIARQLIPVGRPAAALELPSGDDLQAAPIGVTGYVSPPHLHRSTRKDLTLFVNGRLIQDATLNHAVTNAYHTLIHHGRFPIAVLMIQVPPESVDVNVHPAKTEVRFREPRRVFAAVERTVRAAVIDQAEVAPFDALSDAEAGAGLHFGRPGSLRDVPTPTPRPSTGQGSSVPGWRKSTAAGPLWADEAVAWRSGSDADWQETHKSGSSYSPAQAPGRSQAAEAPSEYPPTWTGPAREQAPGLPDADRLTVDHTGSVGSAPESADADTAAEGPRLAGAAGPSARQPGLPPLRILGQVGLAYLVAEGPDGLYLVDQHAAHERVMYEELMSRRAATQRQHLLAPEPVQLSARQRAAAEEFGELLSRAGYELEPFGDDAVLVRSVPEVLARTDAASALGHVLDVLGDDRAPVDEAIEARLVRVVCKQATVKAGQTLTPAEMRALLERLEACESPRTCPHGRPTVVVLSAAQLAATFGR